MTKRGFSLIENLISLSLLLIIFLSSLEFFGFARRLFFKLKQEEETKLSAFSALEKLKIDLLQAGLALLQPIRLGVVEGITESDNSLMILSGEKTLHQHGNLVCGQTRIFLETTEDLKKGREICFFDSSKGEVKIIDSVKRDSIVLSLPLEFSYPQGETSLLLLEKISFYLDPVKKILMRKTNSSPPQPLLEEVTLFDPDYEKSTNLARLCLTLERDKEKRYETYIFPKNIGLALGR